MAMGTPGRLRGSARTLVALANPENPKVLTSPYPASRTFSTARSQALGGAGAAHDKTLGRSHAWTKASARVTAGALDALGRTEEAKALRER
jgi:hypothetical protein